MTVHSVAAPSSLPFARSWIGEALVRPFRDSPVLAGLTLIFLIAIVPTAFAALLDARTIAGVGIWQKPLKFLVSVAIYLGTLAICERWLPARMRASLFHRAFVAIVAAAALYEIIWIAGAAAAGITSHFNVGDPLMARLYTLAGIGAVVLTSGSLVYGLGIAANRRSGLAPALHLSLVLGLVLTFAATIPVALHLGSQMSRFVGGEAGTPAALLPILGWAIDRGDLRPAHFLATHAMHAVPLAGLAAAAFLKSGGGRRVVCAFAAAYAAFIVYAFLEARAGQPFLSSLGFLTGFLTGFLAGS